MASIRKRPERPKPWEVLYRDPEGKQRSSSFARKLDAQRFVNTMEADKLRGTYVDPHAGKVIFREFAEAWLERQTFDATTRISVDSRLRTHVYGPLGGHELRAIKPSVLQAWVRGKTDVLAPSYVALILGHVSSIMAAAVDDQLIPSNPAASKSVKAPKAERRKVVPWTVEQVHAIAEHHPERYEALPILGAGTGMRQGEMFGIAVEDVDWLRHTLHIRVQVRLLAGHPSFAPPKGGRVREVPLSETVAVALSEHLRRYPAQEVTLPWVERDGEPVTRRLIFTGPKGASLNKNTHNERVWKPALREADFEPTRETGMHQLRHHFASVLLDAGVSVAALADYLGHENPSVTLNVYSHMMPDTSGRAREAIDKAHRRDVGQVLANAAQDGS